MNDSIDPNDPRWASLDDDLPKPEQMEAHHDRTGLWHWQLWLGYDYWWWDRTKRNGQSHTIS